MSLSTGTSQGMGQEVTGSCPIGFGLFRDGILGDFGDTRNVLLTSEPGKAGKARLSLHPFRASVSFGSRRPWNNNGRVGIKSGFGNVQGSPGNTGAKRGQRSCLSLFRDSKFPGFLDIEFQAGLLRVPGKFTWKLRLERNSGNFPFDQKLGHSQ